MRGHEVSDELGQDVLRSSQEFADHCIRVSDIAREIALAKGAVGDLVGTLACAVGSQVSLLQGVLWESLVVSAGESHRKYFQCGEELSRFLTESPVSPHESVGGALAFVNSQAQPIFDRIGLDNIEARFFDTSLFEKFPYPERALINNSVASQLHGQTAAKYARKQEQIALELSLQAFTANNSGNIDEAIRLMYASDFTFLKGYLVESAHAAGDRDLLTVQMRWELASHGVSLIEELPRSLPSAVAVVRKGITVFFGEQDAVRFRALLPVV